MARKTKGPGLETHYGPQVSAKNTEEYIAANLKGDAFERHQFDFAKRMLNGHYMVRVFNRGRWRYYDKVSHASARRVNQLQRRYGKEVDFAQYEMPEHIECIDVTKTIRELGYVDA